jgi:hypothetical protein
LRALSEVEALAEGVGPGWSDGLGRTTASRGELANVVEEDGALEGVQLRGVEGDFGEEGVGGEDGGLVAMAGVGVAQERRDVDLKGAGEAIERRERRHGFAVFDFGDVGAGNAHASGELTLGEITDVPQIADGGGYLQAFCLWCRGGYEG